MQGRMRLNRYMVIRAKGAAFVKYLRRFVWYLATRLMLLCAVLGLMVVAFYYSMNATNIYIVLKDGMAKRAQVIMMGEDPADLTKYFQKNFLEYDSALKAAEQGSSPYRQYTIRGIDHRLDMKWMWCWPWEDTAKADITESIPRIDGRANSASREALLAAGGEESLSPPKWDTASYRAILIRENGQWRIKSLTKTN